MKLIGSVKFEEIEKVLSIVPQKFNGVMKGKIELKEKTELPGGGSYLGAILSIDVLIYDGDIIKSSIETIGKKEKKGADISVKQLRLYLSDPKNVWGYLTFIQYSPDEISHELKNIKDNFEAFKPFLLKSKKGLLEFIKEALDKRGNVVRAAIGTEEIADESQHAIEKEFGYIGLMVYQMIDGKKSIGEIVDKTGLPENTIFDIIRRINELTKK